MDKQIFQQAAGLSAALFEFGILEPHRIASWIAQVGTESAGFTGLQESFDYSVNGLQGTFGARMPVAIAAMLGRQPGERSATAKRAAVMAGAIEGAG